MELTLKNYETALPKDLVQLAKKNTVRECDELKKGQFVAYVDEGDESFDVSLQLSNNAVVAHTCDCKAGNTFCRHKAALLMHITGGKKIKATVKAKKKSKVETLLEEAEMNDLKEWVKELILKNKDIELSFIHYFSATEQQYTPEEVTRLTHEAIKAIAGNKKNVDPTQIKKIVELWTDIHAPIMRSYMASAAEEKSFLNLHTLLESCQGFQFKINTNSNRISRYMEGLLQQTVETVNNIYQEEAWSVATGYFIARIPEGTNKIRMYYLLHLKNLVSISSEERKNKLIERLAKQYKKIYSENIFNAAQYTKALFGIVEENGLFPQYFNLFQPIRFDNEFNEKLIRLIIENHHPDLAEKLCHQQIKGNYREEYNVPYLELLKEIYTQQKEEDKLAGILADLFPRTFDFDDFLFIFNRMPEGEEKKKWRTRMITKAKNALLSYNTGATEFYFKLMDHEGSYKKMIDAIDSYTPYCLILRYFEPMARTDKAKLLKAMIEKIESYGWGMPYEQAEKDKECFPELLETVLKYYSPNNLLTAINETEKKVFYYRPNKFLSYAKQNLKTTD